MLKGMAKPLAKLIFLLKPKWRRTQFSLYTLFILMTVLCGALGILFMPAERQRQAVATVRVAGGWIQYAKEANRGKSGTTVYRKTRQEWWPPCRYFDEVRRVGLNSSRLSL